VCANDADTQDDDTRHTQRNNDVDTDVTGKTSTPHTQTHYDVGCAHDVLCIVEVAFVVLCVDNDGLS
jgi:hypothetical protein